jgi:hypothetical protein
VQCLSEGMGLVNKTYPLLMIDEKKVFVVQQYEKSKFICGTATSEIIGFVRIYIEENHIDHAAVKYCRKYDHLMALNGMDSTKLKSSNEQLVLPFESPILRKLAFTKLVDATKTKASMIQTLRVYLLDRVTNCSKRKWKDENTQHIFKIRIF